METKGASPFWWVKPATGQVQDENNGNNLTVPKLDLEISSSLADFLEKEQNILNSNRTDVDVGSIIEEINRVAAQSPLGPYERSTQERSFEDIMREAERVYRESSKSFEQLSQRSARNLEDTSIIDESKGSTPKSISPLPKDDDDDDDESETYSEDFSMESKLESVPSPQEEKGPAAAVVEAVAPVTEANKASGSEVQEVKQTEEVEVVAKLEDPEPPEPRPGIVEEGVPMRDDSPDRITAKDELIKTLEEDNRHLREDNRLIKAELQQITIVLNQTKAALSAKSLCSPELNVELEKTLEELKDSKEINTALQLQLDTINKTHCLLKNSHDDLLTSNRNLERRLAELDASLAKYRSELANLQLQKDKLHDTEISLNKLLEIEKLQSKSLKFQNDKDAKCIQDLNRQIKEMERIIARKHPDSVSALIVAAKKDASESNLTARKILENRIKSLEEEAANRDSQSSRVFLDIQDKFNQMKLKYESHIEDLELHVSDLKSQLKRSRDTFDMYTQTSPRDEKIPQKDTATVGTQTDSKIQKRIEKVHEIKEEAHLIATIRGLQVDLTNKEKVVAKLQKEIEDVKKANRKLQKEREGSFRNLHERREFRSYPEKLAAQARTLSVAAAPDDDEVKALRTERDKMKQQLCRIEEDYQALKNKRIYDLNALQEAHEREVSTYVSNVTPLREQLEIQQVSISTLQSQLGKVKEELLIVTIERDHLNNQLSQLAEKRSLMSIHSESTHEMDSLQKKISFLEKRYEEREYRLRAIVHGLAQKNVMNRSCEQCAERQQQLIEYKTELDQLLATLRALK